MQWTHRISAMLCILCMTSYQYAQAADVPEWRSIDAAVCEAFDTKIKVAFLDADSTLRISRSGKVSANGPKDVYVLPFVAERIKELREKGYLIAVVSNQNGVQYGYVTKEDAVAALQYTAAQLTRLGAEFHYIDMAPYRNYDKKPNTGMGKRLARLLEKECEAEIDYKNSLMVGDAGYSKKKYAQDPENYPRSPDGREPDDFSDSDRLFAEKLGIKFYEPTHYFGWDRYEVYNIHKIYELTNLLKAMVSEAETLVESEKAKDRAKGEALLNVVKGIQTVNELEL